MAQSTETTKANQQNKSIREQLFADTSEGKVVKRTLSNGLEIEMHEPTKGERNRMVAESRIGDSINPLEFMMRVAVNCAYVPGKDIRVFEKEDFDRINDLCHADWVDELVDMAQEVVNISQESMEKN